MPYPPAPAGQPAEGVLLVVDEAYGLLTSGRSPALEQLIADLCRQGRKTRIFMPYDDQTGPRLQRPTTQHL
jgi:ABC-type cobalamin transport system ATPase subunit